LKKSKIVALTVITALLLSFSVFLVAAQYLTEQTTKVTIPSDGTFSASDPANGVSIQIQGTPEATGTVTASIYNGNPQPTATVAAGTSLARFVGITFNMTANDFQQATIVLAYSDSTVQGVSAPYSIYKYDASTNSYLYLPSVVDTTAKTITFTVTSTSDPLFAIGGATEKATPSGGISLSAWTIMVVVVIMLVIIAALFVTHIRRDSRDSLDSEHSFKS
jgi:hypothetical protein